MPCSFARGSPPARTTIALALQHGTRHDVAWTSHQSTLAWCNAGLLHGRVRAITSVAVCITTYLCTASIYAYTRHTYTYCTHILYMRRSCRSLAPCSPGLSVRVVLDRSLFWIDQSIPIQSAGAKKRGRETETSEHNAVGGMAKRPNAPTSPQRCVFVCACARVLRGACACVCVCACLCVCASMNECSAACACVESIRVTSK